MQASCILVAGSDFASELHLHEIGDGIYVCAIQVDHLPLGQMGQKKRSEADIRKSKRNGARTTGTQLKAAKSAVSPRGGERYMCSRQPRPSETMRSVLTTHFQRKSTDG